MVGVKDRLCRFLKTDNSECTFLSYLNRLAVEAREQGRPISDGFANSLDQLPTGATTQRRLNVHTGEMVDVVICTLTGPKDKPFPNFATRLAAAQDCDKHLPGNRVPPDKG